MLLQFDTFRFSLKDFNRYLKSVTYDEYEWKLIYMEQNVYWCSRILQTFIQCERSKLNKPVEFFAPNIYSGNLSHTHAHAHTHSHTHTHARTHTRTHTRKNRTGLRWSTSAAAACAAGWHDVVQSLPDSLHNSGVVLKQNWLILH